MPEGRGMLIRNPSYPLAIMQSPIQFDVIREETISELERSTDSLDALFNLPEIIIPPPLFDPLPLQCIAWRALPDEERKEIDSVVALYASVDDNNVDEGSITEVSVCDIDREEDTPVIRAKPVGLARSESPPDRIMLTRHPSQHIKTNELGVGVKITGGMRCTCGMLHAVITNKPENPELHQGMVVVEWCGHSLEGATYEQVKRILMSTDDIQEIDLLVRECRKQKESMEKWQPTRAISTSFTALGANRRKNSMRKTSKGRDHYTVVVTEEPSEGEDGKKAATSEGKSPFQLKRSLSHELPLRNKDSASEPEPTRPHSLTNLTIPVPKIQISAEEDTPASSVPKSPTLGNDDDFTDFFASLPNGMIKMSLDYGEEQQSLKMVLRQVKGHSSQESETSDLFINTYLIPDPREQGVRSTKVVSSHSDTETMPSYSITKEELDSVALRVILWEMAGKTDTIVFRGEVLLSLSDNEIVNLEGEPMWYTVCSEDPNLPHLPNPVHYRQKFGIEYFFHRVKQTLNRSQAHAINYLKQHTLKPTFSTNTDLFSLGSKDLLNVTSTTSLPGMIRRLSLPGTKALQVNREGATEQSGADSVVSELDEEIQAARKLKLNAILQVLRDTDTTDPFPTEVPDTAYLETPPHYEDDDGTFSTLDRRKRKRQSQDAVKTRSSSFSIIPGLRESLSAGKRNKVLVYSFVEEPDAACGKNDSANGTQPCDGLLHSQQHLSPFSLDQSELPSDSKLHYKLVDENQQDGEDTADETDSTSTIKPQSEPRPFSTTSSVFTDCSCYSAEVSLQDIRIDAEDVFAEEARESRAAKYSTMPLPQNAQSSRRKPMLLPLAMGDGEGRLKHRKSRSVGDIDNLELEEALHLQSPPTPTPQQLPSHEAAATIPQVGLITHTAPHPTTNNLESAAEPVQDSRVIVEPQQPLASGISPTASAKEESSADQPTQDKKKWSKWGSLDDLLESLPITRPKSRKFRRKSQQALPPSRSIRKWSTASEHGKNTGSVKLDLHYEEQSQILTVKLTDVAFLSSKGSISDFVAKVYIHHNNTGVRITKKKASINLKKKISSTSSDAVFQFSTDITNLSLQICLAAGGKLFSRKTGQVWVDLSSIPLLQKGRHTQWYQLTKVTTV